MYSVIPPNNNAVWTLRGPSPCSKKKKIGTKAGTKDGALLPIGDTNRDKSFFLLWKIFRIHVNVDEAVVPLFPVDIFNRD